MKVPFAISGTFVGVGALGSQIVNLWQRSGWGRWAVIDSDHVKPHNLSRHTAFERHIGYYKVDALADLERQLYGAQPAALHVIAEDATRLESERISQALDAADIIVDASTDPGFPRTIATRSSVKRAMSVFITPSGHGAVMLLEDTARTIRLDALEYQYYRQVIAQPWGAEHLAGNQGHLWTGAGCRDLSAVIPNELVSLHAANLAWMARRKLASADASLLVWRYQPDNGGIKVDSCVAQVPRTSSLNGLKIVWDDEIRTKARTQREACLPNETGGVLLGYFDLVLDMVFIVDALAAPPDSQGERTGFVRGVEGLEAAIEEAARRTGWIVRYVGEWHSHPRGHTPDPSGLDLILLVHLATGLDAEGLPAVMLIVGEDDETWVIGRMA